MGRHWKRDHFGTLSPEVREVKILAFDCETRESHLEYEEDKRHSGFILGCVFDGEKFYDFYDQESMIEFFRMPKWAGYQVWACNLEYDLNAAYGGRPSEDLFRNYFGGALKGAQFVQERRRIPAKGKKRKKGDTNSSNRILHFCDTLNQWKASVAQMGEMIGVEKLEMPEHGLPDREMLTYCRRDAEIVWRFVAMMQKEYNDFGCELKGSIASSSMDLFRRKYMRPEHGFRRIPMHFIRFFQQGYFGGRTENFVRGRFGRVADRDSGPYKSVHTADVNSMYPAVMHDVKVPILTRPHCTKHAHGLEFEGMTRAIVTVPEQKFPPLPYRHAISKIATKLYFPMGTWEGVFCNSELRYAIEHCGVKIDKIIECVYFLDSDYVYKDYVTDVYNERLKSKATGDEVRSYMMKIFGNSLYGKAGQIGEVLTIAPKWMLKKDDTFEPFGKYAARRQEGKPAIFTNFIWAAHVTSGARCQLHSHLVELDALYCDTDSVFSYTKVPTVSDLGALSHEESTPFFEVLGPKTYKTKTKTRMKGVPADAFGADMKMTNDGFMEFTFRPIKEMDHLPREVFFTEVSRFRGAIRNGILPNSWGIGEKVIRLLPEDRKRHFFKNGQSRPLTIEEIQEMRPPWAGVEMLPYFECEGEIRTKQRRA